MKPALLALLVLTAGAAGAVEEELPGPFTIHVGYSGMYPGTRDLAGKNGVLIGVAAHDAQAGFFGQRGVELDYRFAQTANGRVDDVGLMYLERFPMQNQVYGVLAAGVWAFRVVDRRFGGYGTFSGIRPGAKAAVGYQFAMPESDVRLALEFAVVVVPPVNSYTTTGLSAALVLGF